jgi:hypothetical protein
MTREALPNYAWVCANKCLAPVDTGVPADEETASTNGRSPVEILFAESLSQLQIRTAKVYAPTILIHFIDCHTPGCYEQIYRKFLVPHFDSASVLDYVLRTPIIRSEEILKDGMPEPKMCAELLHRLRGIQSPRIQDYLVRRFGHMLV